ncbi:glycosyltransferase, partial [bacterium]|nr:glycosyltransferase [bacterium]
MNKESCNNNKPNRLLFLARPFPPKVSAGCVRTWNIAKYLKKRGWDVTVLTPDPSHWANTENIQEVNEQICSLGINRILTGLDRKYLIPGEVNISGSKLKNLLARICVKGNKLFGGDNFSGWIKPAMKVCRDFIPGDYDIVLGTGMPFVTFIIAEQIAEKLKCPFVLDYRDAWSGNPHGENHDRPCNFKEESRLIRNAAAITTVSNSLANLISDNYNCNSKMSVLMNGYDPCEFRNYSQNPSKDFKLLYCGRL